MRSSLDGEATVSIAAGWGLGKATTLAYGGAQSKAKLEFSLGTVVSPDHAGTAALAILTWSGMAARRMHGSFLRMTAKEKASTVPRKEQ